MAKLILHHFDISPFAEKARLVLGLKKLSWDSVQIPLIMPKPDLTALTGGYRKTPVLQIGAEIYCDTTRIALELEERYPKPGLFPGGNRGLALASSFWSNSAFFNPGAGLSMAVNSEIPEPILEDRKNFFNFMDFERMQEEIPHMYTQLLAHMELVEAQLSDGRSYFAGEEPGWLDINAYFVVWMARNNVAPVNELLKPYTSMQLWESRMQALGHGDRSELEADYAIEIARSSTPAAGKGVDIADPLGLSEEDAVVVEPDDYGKEPVSGTLITLTRNEVSIRRTDERAGEVNVHFPRAGYRITRQ